MTPEEKAKELVEKFSKLVEIHNWHYKNIDHEDVYTYSPSLSDMNAKACSIICCDEIIDFMIADDHKHKDASWSNSSEMVYWHNVKKEIQKL